MSSSPFSLSSLPVTGQQAEATWLALSTAPGCKQGLTPPPTSSRTPSPQVSAQEELASRIPLRHASWRSPRAWSATSIGPGGPRGHRFTVFSRAATSR